GSGTGGSLEIGGTLTPLVKITPWEVSVGASVNDLSASIPKGQSAVSVPLTKAIPLLGIRSIVGGFVGAAGLDPQIDYGGAVDFAASVNGVAPVTLTVKNAADNSEIGTLTTSMDVIARHAWKITDNPARSENFNVWSSTAGTLFYGGVGSSKAAAAVTATVGDAAALFPGVTDTYDDWGGRDRGDWGNTTTDDPAASFSSFYASAIKASSVINLTLNAPAASDSISWKASLPITVSYD
ncbi:TPA: hypothetical protein ACXZV3_004735, partial [Salmonella enterica]